MLAFLSKNLSCTKLSIRLAALQIIEPESSLSGICADKLESEVSKVLKWIENMPLLAAKSFAWEIILCEQD